MSKDPPDINSIPLAERAMIEITLRRAGQWPVRVRRRCRENDMFGEWLDAEELVTNFLSDLNSGAVQWPDPTPKDGEAEVWDVIDDGDWLYVPPGTSLGAASTATTRELGRDALVREAGTPAVTTTSGPAPLSDEEDAP